MKRVLAVALALLLIVAALLFRIGRDDSDDVSAGGPKRDDGELVLGCVPELEAVCRSLEGVNIVNVNHDEIVEKAGTIDAWVTFDPWPTAVAFDNEGIFGGDALPLGEDGLGLVLSEDYETELRGGCPLPTTLTACAAERTRSGGDLGVGDPGTAIGRVLLAAAVTEIIGKAEIGNEDVEAEGTLIDSVLSSMPKKSSASQLDDRLGLGPPAAMAILCRRHDGQVVDTTRGGQKRLVFRATDHARLLRVVLAPISRNRQGDLEDLAKDESTVESFKNAGWSKPSGGPTGLPPGDVLLLLGD